MSLSLEDRTKIFEKSLSACSNKHFDPGMNGANWKALTQSRRGHILTCADPEAFEKEVHKLVAELRRAIPDSDMPECATFRRPTRLMRLSSVLVRMAMSAGCFRTSITEDQPTLQGYKLEICYLNVEAARFVRRRI